MKIKIYNYKNGLTLTELVVACMIMGVIMTGVAAFGLSVKSMHETTSKSSLLAARMRAALSQLSRDASLAIGDSSDSGIDELFFHLPDHYQICFRHDVQGSPEDYTDDEWVCYGHGASFNIHRAVIAPANFKRNTWWQYNCFNCEEFSLVTVTSDKSKFFDIVTDAQGRLQYIDLFLTSKYDNDANVDPIQNPKMTMTTRVNPTMHTR